MSRRKPKGTIIAAARAMCRDGADAATIRASLVASHDRATADQVITRLRRGKELPARTVKLELIPLKPGPKTRDRLRALAAKRGISHARVARQALAAGLTALEARP